MAKSLPLAGPSPTRISRRWISRADQSFMIVYPKMCPRPRPGRDRGRADPRPPRPPARNRGPGSQPAQSVASGPTTSRSAKSRRPASQTTPAAWADHARQRRFGRGLRRHRSCAQAARGRGSGAHRRTSARLQAIVGGSGSRSSMPPSTTRERVTSPAAFQGRRPGGQQVRHRTRQGSPKNASPPPAPNRRRSLPTARPAGGRRPRESKVT